MQAYKHLKRKWLNEYLKVGERTWWNGATRQGDQWVWRFSDEPVGFTCLQIQIQIKYKYKYKYKRKFAKGTTTNQSVHRTHNVIQVGDFGWGPGFPSDDPEHRCAFHYYGDYRGIYFGFYFYFDV